MYMHLPQLIFFCSLYMRMCTTGNSFFTDQNVILYPVFLYPREFNSIVFLIFAFPPTYYVPVIFFLPFFCWQREYDENEVDPYHGQQEKEPEVEPLDLPDNLNLENDEKSDEEEENEGTAENISTDS